MSKHKSNKRSYKEKIIRFDYPVIRQFLFPLDIQIFRRIFPYFQALSSPYTLIMALKNWLPP